MEIYRRRWQHSTNICSTTIKMKRSLKSTWVSWTWTGHKVWKMAIIGSSQSLTAISKQIKSKRCRLRKRGHPVHSSSPRKKNVSLESVLTSRSRSRCRGCLTTQCKSSMAATWVTLPRRKNTPLSKLSTVGWPACSPASAQSSTSKRRGGSRSNKRGRRASSNRCLKTRNLKRSHKWYHLF